MEDIFLTGKRHKVYPQLSSFPCTEGKEQPLARHPPQHCYGTMSWTGSDGKCQQWTLNKMIHTAAWLSANTNATQNLWT